MRTQKRIVGGVKVTSLRSPDTDKTRPEGRTAVRNEAAERLREMIADARVVKGPIPKLEMEDALSAALVYAADQGRSLGVEICDQRLAAERSATVERIRQAIRDRLFVDDFDAKETAAASQVLQDVTAFLAEIEQS